MTEEEYQIRLKALEADFARNKKSLAHQFAFSNNKYKVGDIVSDRIYTIKIEQIKWSQGAFYNNPLPHCVYIGTILNKDLTVPKRIKQGEIRNPIE